LKARTWIGVGAALVVGLVVVGRQLPGIVEAQRNAKVPASGAISETQAALIAKMPKADMHADPLLWGRDLTERSDVGHWDIPRAQDASLRLQVFGIVTHSKVKQDYRGNSEGGDVIGPLLGFQGAPMAAWWDYAARAEFQIERFNGLVERSNGALTPIRTRADITALMKGDPKTIGGILALEGAQPLDDGKTMQDLFDLGVRVVGVAHFYDNGLGGSMHGLEKGGLSQRGREMVQEANRLHMILDLAHASRAVVDEVLNLSTQPVIVSHTGVASKCPGDRNLGAARMRQIADAGGLIAIAFFDPAVCDISPSGVADAIRAAVDTVGVEHVVLGSDWDGAVTVSMDVSELDLLAAELMRQGMVEADVAAVMGRNALRFFATHLP